MSGDRPHDDRRPIDAAAVRRAVAGLEARLRAWAEAHPEVARLARSLPADDGRDDPAGWRLAP
jgi:hypothetical protein